MKNTTHHPFPQLVTTKAPFEWEIVPSENPNAGCCDHSNRKLQIPIGEDHISQLVRRHELGHAAFPQAVSRKRIEKLAIHPPAAQIACDIWTAVRCAKREVQTVCDCLECISNMQAVLPTLCKEKLPNDPQAERKYACLVSLAMGQAMAGATGTQDLVHPFWRQVARLAKGRTILPLAKYLTDVFDLLPKGERRSEQATTTGGASEQVRWPEPKWITVPLTEHIKQPRHHRFAAEGVPIAPHRVADDTIAILKQRCRGVSVLIDTSSSMELSQDDLTHILRKYPASIVATYSRGQMTIAAKGGRAARAADVHFGGWNTTDLPSLKWLSQQPLPRFWISDGYVNAGQGHSSRPDFLNLCARLCVQFCFQHHITLIPAATALA